MIDATIAIDVCFHMPPFSSRRRHVIRRLFLYCRHCCRHASASERHYFAMLYMMLMSF